MWAKLIVHDIELNFYPDNKIGMNDLCAEIEKQNNSELATPPRYLTKPSNKERKTHSFIVIALENREEAKHMMQPGTYICSFAHRSNE